MRVEKRQGGDVRRILTAMIVDKVVLGRVASKWDKDEGLFDSTWANLIAGWCVSYHERYNEAPGARIQARYESWIDKGQKDEETVAALDRLLSNLSDKYEQEAAEINPQYVIDIADDYFNRIRLQKHAEAIIGFIDAGDIKEAKKKADTFGHIEMSGGSGLDVLAGRDALEAAFAGTGETLIEYPGALGEFFNKSLKRDNLVAFMAPEKRGKTWWLIDIAWNAMLQRRKVMFFSVGDMSQNQMLIRLGTRASRIPVDPCTVRVPTAIEKDPDAPFANVPSFKEKVHTVGLTPGAAWEAFATTAEKRVKSADSYFKLFTHPNSSISVAGLRSIVQSHERQGWVPDVIVVDYADILAPPYGVIDSRHQIDATWRQLRGLSQDTHSLVVTATQSDAASYDTEVLSRKNFSEDKRKFAHVTDMVGINATAREMDDGIYRLNHIVIREQKNSERKVVHIAGCLDIGHPALHSTW